jgi:RHS repeat-associated protein
MRTSWILRGTSALIGVLLVLSFGTAYAVVDSLGTWSAYNPGLSKTQNYDIVGIAYGNNTFVMVGQNAPAGTPFTANSPDGKKWTIRPTGSGADTFNSVLFANGRFIAVCKQPNSGNARIWTSDDNGATWKPRDSDNLGLIVAGGLHELAWDGNQTIVAVGGTPAGTGWITVSNDGGTTWRVVRQGTSYFSPPSELYGVGYGLGYWYAFTMSGIYRSSDTSTWSYIEGPGVDQPYGLGYKVASNATTVVAATYAGPQWTADNGKTWHLGVPATGFETVGSLTSAASSVVYADGLFVSATRSSGDIWVSETGRYWKRWKLPTTSQEQTFGLCYAQKSFWVAGIYESLSRSPAWFKSRLGASSDYPYTLFDAEDGPPNRIGLPQYRVNTGSLNLILESTLFYTPTLGAPISFKLTYNSKPTADTDTSIGLFGKNWRFKYESAVGRFGQEAQVMAGGGLSHAFTTPNGEDLDSITQDVTLNPPDGIFDTFKYFYNGGASRFELTLKTSHLTYVYGAAGNGANNTGLFYLTAIKDPFGHTVQISRDAPTGKILSVLDSSNRVFTFTYNANNLCAGIAMPDGRSVSFQYDSHKDLTDIHDMMNYHGSYVYDANGFLTSMTTEGKTSAFTYAVRPGYEAGTVENPGDMYLTSLTRANGQTTKYAIQKDGDKIQRTDPAGKATLLSNMNGQTTAISDPLGNVRNITYNSAMLPQAVVDELGGTSTYQYDGRGNMIKKTDAYGKSSTYTYDSNNNTTSVKNALGQEWDYTYNGFYQPLSVKTPLANVTSLSYLGNGRLQSMTDPRRKTTTYAYDGFGNLTSVTPPIGSLTFSYDSLGFHCTSMTDANGKSKSIAWDNNDRLTKVTYTSAAGSPSYTNTYSAFGQVKFTDELSENTSIARDDLGLITSVTDPLGNVTQTKYDADNRPVQITDPLGRTSSTTYDSAGRPVVFTDNSGFTVVRAYDAVGNVVSFNDSNGSKSTYAFDKNNRVISSTDPLKNVTTMTRDDTGRISSTTNARKQTVILTYDNDGRLTKKEVKLTPTGNSTTIASYVFDPNGNVTSQADAWGTTTYTYDDNNQVTSITYPDGKSVTLAWKPGGQLGSISYPDGLVATYTYDNYNRTQVPSALKNNPGTELFGASRTTSAITAIAVSGTGSANFTFSYNGKGQITQLTRSNGTHTDYQYDSGGRLTQIAHSGVDLTAAYSPDAVGNISSETLSGAGSYMSSQTLASLALTYNQGGELTNKGTQACLSDADGNLTDLGSKTVQCTYDALNKLTNMARKVSTKNTDTTTYTYNAAGLRVKTALNGADNTIFHYLPSGALLFTTDVTTNTMTDNILAAGSLLATYTSGTWLHYYGDRQAHVRLIADNSGKTLVKYDYLPYGQVAAEKLGVNDAAIAHNPYTFNGILGVRDEGNGIFFMTNRFYDASAARFLQKDPLGLSVGPNLYAFGGDNPMTFSDPTGKNPILAVVGAVVGTVALVLAIDRAWTDHRREEEKKQQAYDARINSLRQQAIKEGFTGIGIDNYVAQYSEQEQWAHDLNTVVAPVKLGVEVGKEVGEHVAIETVAGPLGEALEAEKAVEAAKVIHEVHQINESYQGINGEDQPQASGTVPLSTEKAD